ncbi:hypothetical protein CXF35_00775 [Corynebacterium bovis]|uniref:Uncharacterized protein n=1 Tax=Corynebacterium bovis TaxID=36808 RepID=A0A426Q4D3_9CORY|nr:hypothetical protein CXF40_03160 [Corynebacterium bovis]RRO98629.1 hypothetical protein CXF32_00330 [Corynebacterium bovis]RRO99678.1 hypothetical protein CXF41_08960 [Corynebacterium bovis]RRQ00432.1 hypothetical protein CXF31_00765 [Corynebacterium bovis]RRQ03544.1 hypothetical protein CXF42_06990 [Corynebacterium bovis]
MEDFPFLLVAAGVVVWPESGAMAGSVGVPVSGGFGAVWSWLLRAASRWVRPCAQAGRVAGAGLVGRRWLGRVASTTLPAAFWTCPCQAWAANRSTVCRCRPRAWMISRPAVARMVVMARR